MKKFTAHPQSIAPAIIVATYAAAALRPMSDATVVTDIAFIAGPTIRNTNAAPGETPFRMSDAAIGIDAVTAATISSRAVTRAVNKACAVYKALSESGYIRLPDGYGAASLPPASNSDAPSLPEPEAAEDNGGENNG